MSQSKPENTTDPKGGPIVRAIFVPLAASPWLKFKERRKTVEVRQLGSPVARQVLKDTTAGRHVTLSHGYGKQERLHGRLGIVWTAHGLDDLPPLARKNAALSGDMAHFHPEADLVAFEVLF